MFHIFIQSLLGCIYPDNPVLCIFLKGEVGRRFAQVNFLSVINQWSKNRCLLDWNIIYCTSEGTSQVNWIRVLVYLQKSLHTCQSILYFWKCSYWREGCISLPTWLDILGRMHRALLIKILQLKIRGHTNTAEVLLTIYSKRYST